MENLKVSVGTWVRTVALIIVLVNQILAVLGISPIPFDEDQVNLVASTVATGVVAVWTWWKNNSFTKHAKLADKVMNESKNKTK